MRLRKIPNNSKLKRTGFMGICADSVLVSLNFISCLGRGADDAVYPTTLLDSPATGRKMRCKKFEGLGLGNAMGREDERVTDQKRITAAQMWCVPSISQRLVQKINRAILGIVKRGNQNQNQKFLKLARKGGKSHTQQPQWSSRHLRIRLEASLGEARFSGSLALTLSLSRSFY